MAENPLQGRELFLWLTNETIGGTRHPPLVSLEDSRDVVLSLVNDEFDEGPEWVEAFADAFRGWLLEYYRDGISEGLVSRLNEELIKLKTFCWLEYVPTSGQTEWQILPGGDQTEPRAMAAHKLGQLLTAGYLDNLKRCASDECHKFYVRNPKAKYCSDTCASRERVRTKRKRDKERQML